MSFKWLPRDQKVDKIIRLAFSSLESHLKALEKPSPIEKNEGRAFHRECVREYAEIITMASNLYD